LKKNSMAEFSAKSPTRIDLAGGTLDVGQLYLFFDRTVTVNLAIDIFTHAKLTELSGSKVRLVSRDLDFDQEYKDLADCLDDTNPKTLLFRKFLGYFRPQKGFFFRDLFGKSSGGWFGGKFEPFD